MSEKKYKRKKTVSNPVMDVVFSVITGNIVFILLISAVAVLIMNVSVDSELFFLCFIVCSAVSSFIASLYASRKVKKNKLFFGMLSCAIIVLIHFVVVLCFNNIQLSMKTYFLFPIAIVCGFAGSLIGINLIKK